MLGRSLVPGNAIGACLKSSMALSFWGGVDPQSAIVIDVHHPLHGESVHGKVLAIPGARGSCSGSGVLLELIQNGVAPAALIVSEPDEILSLGAIVSELMFDKSLPVIQISPTQFAQLNHAQELLVADNEIQFLNNGDITSDAVSLEPSNHKVSAAVTSNRQAESVSRHSLDPAIHLSSQDQAMLAGSCGRATQVAMQILVRMAALQGARHLLDVTQAHIDACVYNGKSSLQFAQKLVQWNAQVRVPTTLNAISVDQQRWREQGIACSLGEPASRLGDCYTQMGAQMSFTCAPYLLPGAPELGEQIVWAESNAVMYANSVIGARTQKYPDFLDVCIALTGRAPDIGCHTQAGRRAGMLVTTDAPIEYSDDYWPLLGYHMGLLTGNQIPLINGLEHLQPSNDDLKAFCAAFATTSSVPLVHIAGLTPEADWAAKQLQSDSENGISSQHAHITLKDLRASWLALNTASTNTVDLICFGNPHFSLSECAALTKLCIDRQKHSHVQVYITLGRAIYAQASDAGYVESLECFGAQFITDTCWCMLGAPVVPASAQVLMTNSGKYAHYAPGLVEKKVYFDSTANCINAACQAKHISQLPDWLDAA